MDATNRTNAPPPPAPSKLRPSADAVPDGHSVTKRYIHLPYSDISTILKNMSER